MAKKVVATVTDKQARQFGFLTDQTAALEGIQAALVDAIVEKLQRKVERINKRRRELWDEIGEEHGLDQEVAYRFRPSTKDVVEI